MTLREWCKRADVLMTEPTTECGAVSLVLDQASELRTGLWHLDDYLVSSVSGPVVWLVPYVSDDEDDLAEAQSRGPGWTR
jgi:hypothetical protein